MGPEVIPRYLCFELRWEHGCLAEGTLSGLRTPEDPALVGLEEAGLAPPASTVTSESASSPLPQIP